MTGYSWHHLFRQTPQTGLQVVTDTRQAFYEGTVAGSVRSGARRMRLLYKLDRDESTDVNRRDNSRIYGVRMEVGIAFELLDQIYQQHLANVVNRMLDPDEWQTELSIDGGGTYNDVALVAYSGPTPIKSAMVMASYEINVRSVELLDEIPYVPGALATPLTTEPLLTLPPASLAYRWQHRTIWSGPGTSSVSYVCQPNSNSVETYEWVPYASSS